MLDLDTRTAILALHARGQRMRAIARALGVSRNSVKSVIQAGSAEVPALDRTEKAEPYLDQIRRLHRECDGNLVRVRERLLEEPPGVDLAYSTVTAFCRRHGIGVKEKKAAGRYHFAPGEEMQHDTSPHSVTMGGKRRDLQCASLVLCYSRQIFAQLFPTWNRFYAKVFLTDAFRYHDGAAGRCMLDNSTVIIAHGRGASAVPAPEMKAFADRFGFVFRAHEVGDANRSARVERPFHYIENNFYAGRTFADLADLNRQLVVWCNQVNGSYKRHLHAKPIELYAAEKPTLRPLPFYIPEVYQLHHRTVDLEGMVTVHNNRYSVPEGLIDRRLEIRESKDQIRIFHRHRLVATHVAFEPRAGRRNVLPEHRSSRRARRNRSVPTPEERELEAVGDEVGRYVTALKARRPAGATRTIRRLHALYLDHPDGPFRRAVRAALEYGLFDIGRLERMILREAAGRFFRIPIRPEEIDDR